MSENLLGVGLSRGQSAPLRIVTASSGSAHLAGQRVAQTHRGVKKNPGKGEITGCFNDECPVTNDGFTRGVAIGLRSRARSRGFRASAFRRGLRRSGGSGARPMPDPPGLVVKNGTKRFELR